MWPLKIRRSYKILALRIFLNTLFARLRLTPVMSRYPNDLTLHIQNVTNQY